MNLDPATAAAVKARAPERTPEQPACTVWPSNTAPVAIFEAMLTQWRIGPCGYAGLDLAVLPGVAQSCGIAPRRAWRLLPEIQVMEAEALEVFAEHRAAKD